MIVCFGDSITYGQGLWDQAQAFPALLEEALGVPVLNRGYCGDTTRVALERFPRDVQESGAEKVVIQFGHNDCNVWQSDNGRPRVNQPSFISNLIEMRERADAFGIWTVFLAPHATKLGPEYEARRKRYVDAMNYLGSSVAGLAEVHLLDHIHPSPAGHKAIAEHLRAWLR